MTENIVREQYGYKRTLDLRKYKKDAQAELKSKLFKKVLPILNKSVKEIKELDEETELKFYSIDSTRWKIKYKEIQSSFENEHKSVNKFVEEFAKLSKLNNGNALSYKNMFFDAAKYIAPYDKEQAIFYYFTHLYYDHNFTTKTKEFTKKALKELFTTDEQLSKFTAIKEELIKENKLEAALEKIPSIYYVERKKITLDSSSIKNVQSQHSETVDLLNEYLQDEKETNKEIKSTEKSISKPISKSSKKTKPVKESSSNYLAELNLTQIQKTVLDTFKENNFKISHQKFEKLATQNGMFKNQLLESINETVYEILDDVLIEEEEKNYTIYPTYYQKLITK